MKKIIILSFTLLMLASMSEAQWSFNGTHIYNSNTGNVGIGTGVIFAPAYKLHINNGPNTASIMCESSYTGTANYPLGYIRLRNTATNDMFNMVLRKNGTVHEMLQSCYDATAGLWREFIYYNYGTRKYEMRNGVMDAEFKNSGNILFNNSGYVGIGTSSPDAPLSVANTNLGGLATAGSFQIGQSITYNLVLDNNEVQARYNGAGNTLFLQYWGGDLNACSSGGSATFFGPVAINSNLNISGRIGVKTAPLYDLHISSSDYTAAYISSSYNGGTTAEIIASGTTAGTWGLYSYATTLGYAAYFSGNVYCTGSYLPSDERLKENIQPLENALDKIMKLDIKTYYFKQEFAKMNLPVSRQYGFTAQNIENVFPELVKLNPAKGEEQPIEFKAVNYIGMIPVLTEAIKEQQLLLNDKDEKIDHLQKQFDDLQNQFNDLKALVLENQQNK
jgi:hypothetical protein